MGSQFSKSILTESKTSMVQDQFNFKLTQSLLPVSKLLVCNASALNWKLSPDYNPNFRLLNRGATQRKSEATEGWAEVRPGIGTERDATCGSNAASDSSRFSLLSSVSQIRPRRRPRPRMQETPVLDGHSPGRRAFSLKWNTLDLP